MDSSNKKYGLILASTRRAEELRSMSFGGVRKLNVLRTSDDELEEDDHQQEENQLCSKKKRGEGNSAQQAQQLRLMREALEEDPSIFEYDEHYDALKAKETASQQNNKQPTTEPRYMGRILQSAQRRQLQRERWALRRQQRERQAECGAFDDKEAFVTPAYAKKLEEIRQAEARENLMEVIEEKNEAARDRSTSLFYKEIFDQRLGTQTALSGGDGGTAAAATGSSASYTPDSNQGCRLLSRDSNETNRKSDKEGSTESSSDGRCSDHEPGLHSRRPGGRVEDCHSFNSHSKKSNGEFRKTDDGSEKMNVDQRVNRKSSSKPGSTSVKSENILTEQESEARPNLSRERSDQRLPSKSRDDDDVKPSARRDLEGIKEKIPPSDDGPTDVREKVEIKEDRVAKLFTKRTVGAAFTEAQQRYQLRKENGRGAGGAGL